MPELHPSPLADEVCVGMLNLRGMIVPVVDFAQLIGVATDAAAPTSEAGTDERRIVVTKQQGIHFGLLVDEVCSIVGYHDDDLLAMPAYSQRQVELFAGCLAHDEMGNIILLKPDALCAHTRITSIASSRRGLYRAGQRAVETTTRVRSGSGRSAYVTFRLEHLYGVPISQLREVIDYPDDVVRAPGLPPYVLGMLNLRRELTTVIDVRSLYAMQLHRDLANTKVLVVEHRDEKYGLVVDALDNIVTIDAADRIEVPAIFMQQVAGGMSNSLKEAVELPGCGTVMLLDLAAVCEHLAADEQAMVEIA